MPPTTATPAPILDRLATPASILQLLHEQGVMGQHGSIEFHGDADDLQVEVNVHGLGKRISEIVQAYPEATVERDEFDNPKYVAIVLAGIPVTFFR